MSGRGAVPTTPKGAPPTPKGTSPAPQTPSHIPSTPSIPAPVTPSPSTPTAESFRNAVLWAASQPQYKDAPIRTLPQIASGPPPKEPVRAKGGKLEPADVQLVQSLIEKCLQLYLNQAEVITALRIQSNIEPGFTALVWRKLEEQNPLFFRAYNIRLRVKEQIAAFNYLVSQQAQLVNRAQPPPVSTASLVSVDPAGKRSVNSSPAFAALSNPLKALGPPSGSTTPIIDTSPASLVASGNFPPPLNLPPSAGAPSLLSSATFPTLSASGSNVPIPAALRDSRGVLTLSNTAVSILSTSNADIPDLDTNQFFSLPEEKGGS